MVILERDGVINRWDGKFITAPERWTPLDGSLEAITHLNRLYERVVIATNQPALDQGTLEFDDLNAIHAKMHSSLVQVSGHLDGIFFCSHEAAAGCRCRKPGTGLFDEIARRFRVQFRDSWLVGDTLADVEAAKAIGARAVLVRSGRGWDSKKLECIAYPVEIYDDLAAFVSNFSKEQSTGMKIALSNRIGNRGHEV